MTQNENENENENKHLDALQGDEKCSKQNFKELLMQLIAHNGVRNNYICYQSDVNGHVFLCLRRFFLLTLHN